MESNTEPPESGQEIKRAATLKRLAEQIEWYTKEAKRDGALYGSLKVVSIASAATVSVLAAGSGPPLVVAGLGAVVVVAEGIQAVFQLHTNSVTFGKTKEVLKREEALYRARAKPYAGVRDPDRMLAERIEAIAALELDAWFDSRLKETTK